MFRWVVPIALGVLIRVAPSPASLNPNAWHYFALFVAVIAALITEPLAGAAVGLIGVSIATVSMFVGKTAAEALKWARSGFCNDTVWLIFAATVFAVWGNSLPVPTPILGRAPASLPKEFGR